MQERRVSCSTRTLPAILSSPVLRVFVLKIEPSVLGCWFLRKHESVRAQLDNPRAQHNSIHRTNTHTSIVREPTPPRPMHNIAHTHTAHIYKPAPLYTIQIADAHTHMALETSSICAQIPQETHSRRE